MIEFLSHLIGFCPDHAFHPSLLCAIPVFVGWVLGIKRKGVQK
jgi:hypothetical protein